MDRTVEASVTETLAREMATTPPAAIPRPAMDAIKRLFIDHIGITYMGHALTGKSLHDYARDVGGRPDAILIGSGVRVAAELAAGVNAQVCRNTDFEETGPAQHTGPLNIHTAFAMAQRTGASGREMLAASALGYVLNGRFHFSRRTDNTAPQHRIVAAAIAARLQRFDTEKTARAMSLAMEFPLRPHAFPLEAKAPTPKRISPLGMQPFFHARAGVQAAVMIKHDFESVRDEIDNIMGDYDIAALTSPTTPWGIITEHMELKSWVASRGAQCAMQSLDELVKQHRIDPQAIKAIRLKLSKMYLRPHQWEPAPDNYWQAIYSTQWAASMVLQQVPPGPQWVTAERLADPFSRQLAAMVEITEDEESTRAYVELRRLDCRGTAEIDVGGQTHAASQTNRNTWGAGSRPMTDAMVADKFLEATSLSMEPSRARNLLAALQNIEQISDVNAVAALL